VIELEMREDSWKVASSLIRVWKELKQ
jgi:hypothetical protein